MNHRTGGDWCRRPDEEPVGLSIIHSSIKRCRRTLPRKERSAQRELRPSLDCNLWPTRSCRARHDSRHSSNKNHYYAAPIHFLFLGAVRRLFSWILFGRLGILMVGATLEDSMAGNGNRPHSCSLVLIGSRSTGPYVVHSEGEAVVFWAVGPLRLQRVRVYPMDLDQSPSFDSSERVEQRYIIAMPTKRFHPAVPTTSRRLCAAQYFHTVLDGREPPNPSASRNAPSVPMY